MRNRLKRFTWLVLIMFLLFTVVSCAPYFGAPSMTLLAPNYPQNSDNIELVGGVDEVSEDFYWVLIFLLFGQPQPTHEGVVSKFLEKHNADLIVNAEVTCQNIVIPYLFTRIRTTVKGQPARIIDGGAK